MTAPAPERATTRVVLLGLLLLGVVAVTAFLPWLRVDPTWRAWVIDWRSGALDQVFTTASVLGSSLVLTPVAVVLTVVLALRGHRSDALLLGGTTLGVLLLGPLLKVVIERPRPAQGHLVAVHSWSYPSGHSLVSMAVLGALIVLATRHLPTPPARAVAVVAGVLLIGAVGLSRVYLGVHWPTDVLAGWLLGATWLGLVLVLVRRGRGRAARGSTASPRSR
ncbi:phosphatase PAP2 family protein [Actinophytocola sediminis]